MNWKTLLPLPLAALLLGAPVHPPTLREAIPTFEGSGCRYTEAKRLYLLAYAYSVERPQLGRRALSAAETELLACVGDAKILEKRVRTLKALFPAKDSSRSPPL